MITFLHEKRRQVRQCNQQLTKSKPCAAGSSIRWGDPQPQHQGPLAIASRSNLSLLPARPASEQIFRSVIEHALRVIFRKLDHVHHDVRVIDIFQWLLEATRASFRMNDDVPAEAMLQKTPCGHARHEENRWWKRGSARPFLRGHTIPAQSCGQGSKTSSALPCLEISLDQAHRTGSRGHLRGHTKEPSPCKSRAASPYPRKSQISRRYRSEPCLHYFFLRSQGQMRPPLELRIVYRITHFNESVHNQLRMNSWATPTACLTNVLILIFIL